jgi:hypothetical protein
MERKEFLRGTVANALTSEIVEDGSEGLEEGTISQHVILETFEPTDFDFLITDIENEHPLKKI